LNWFEKVKFEEQGYVTKSIKFVTVGGGVNGRVR